MFDIDPETLHFIGFIILVYGGVGLIIYINHRMAKRR
jgi:phage shock protein PspC (stress-responsive transcriptional regulator)